MFVRLFALFVGVVTLETIVLVNLHRAIGLAGTIGLILGTGALAAWLVKREGLRTLATLRTQAGRGERPSQTLVEGVLLLVAAAVLLTPGLITDACGFLLLVPTIRSRVARVAMDRGKATVQRTMQKKADEIRQKVAPGSRQPEVIDVEFERVDQSSRTAAD